mmetsp:Transcript_807/g.1629  ORF Transcript_807/g.1629 Transcript_807/m.1629 type:complete len:391 (+) Transcript_807:400-1572(+)
MKSLCPVRLLNMVGASFCQTRTVRSSPPLTRYRALTVRQRTIEVCPLYVCTQEPLMSSHFRTVWSREPEYRNSWQPSGDRDRACTAPSCSSRRQECLWPCVRQPEKRKCSVAGSFSLPTSRRDLHPLKSAWGRRAKLRSMSTPPRVMSSRRDRSPWSPSFSAPWSSSSSSPSETVTSSVGHSARYTRTQPARQAHARALPSRLRATPVIAFSWPTPRSPRANSEGRAGLRGQASHSCRRPSQLPVKSRGPGARSTEASGRRAPASWRTLTRRRPVRRSKTRAWPSAQPVARSRGRSSRKPQIARFSGSAAAPGCGPRRSRDPSTRRPTATARRAQMPSGERGCRPWSSVLRGPSSAVELLPPPSAAARSAFGGSASSASCLQGRLEPCGV